MSKLTEYRKRRVKELVRNVLQAQAEYIRNQAEYQRSGAPEDGALVDLNRNAFRTSEAILMRFCYGLVADSDTTLDEPKQ